MLDDRIATETVMAFWLGETLGTRLRDTLVGAPKGRFQAWKLQRLLADPGWLTLAPDVRAELGVLFDCAGPIVEAGRHLVDRTDEWGGNYSKIHISDDARLWFDIGTLAEELDEVLAGLAALRKAQLYQADN